MEDKNLQILRQLMLKCKAQDLKHIISQSVVRPSLLETLSTERTVDMELQTSRFDVLKNEHIRRCLLDSNLSSEELVSLDKKIKYNQGHLAEQLSRAQIIDKVSQLNYGANRNSRLILNALGLDTGLCELKKNKKEDLELIKMQDEESFYELFDYQNNIRQQALQYFHRNISGAPRLLIHMPTGAGKTKTAMHILQELWHTLYLKKGCILWLAHTEELLSQAAQAFKNMWQHLGRFDVQIVRLWGDIQFEGLNFNRSLVFGSISKMQSLMRNRNPLLDDLSDFLNLVIIDECHKAAAKQTDSLIKYITEVNSKNVYGNPSHVIGLTATPGRSGRDTEIKKLVHMFDDVKITIQKDVVRKYDYCDYDLSGSQENKRNQNDIEFLQQREILSTFKREPLEINQEELDLSPEELKSIQKSLHSDSEPNDKILNKIAKNVNRNQAIIERLMDVSKKKNKIIFFAVNIDHAKLIYRQLKLQQISVGLVLGETSSEERSRIINKFKNDNSGLKILINVGVLTTGFDHPSIDCVFIARPVGSVLLYSQMIGRGIRGPKMGGNSVCLLVDVVDKLDFGDEKWAFSYFNSYWG